MPSNNCAYRGCKRVGDQFAVTANQAGFETSHYCSGIHAAVAILEQWLLQSKASKTTFRVYNTALAILKKLSDAFEKEWKKTEEK